MFCRAFACALPLAVLATAAIAGAESSPQDMLRGLYAGYDRTHAHSNHVDVHGLMTPQLARAYAKVTRAVPGDAPVMAWDVFVDGRNHDIEHLNLTAEADGKSRTVTAAFDNQGLPVTVVYSFARTSAGWRIDDIRYPPDRAFPKGFSLQAFAHHAG